MTCLNGKSEARHVFFTISGKEIKKYKQVK